MTIEENGEVTLKEENKNDENTQPEQSETIKKLEEEISKLQTENSNLKSKEAELNSLKADLNQTDATASDILFGKKAYSKGKLITGEHTEKDVKGVDWNCGVITTTAGSITNIDVGFEPRYIIITNRQNGSSILYNNAISSNKQYVNGNECELNRTAGSGIVSIGSKVVLRSIYDLTWDWIALR